MGSLVTLVAAVHYMDMREYWVQVHKSPIEDRLHGLDLKEMQGDQQLLKGVLEEASMARDKATAMVEEIQRLREQECVSTSAAETKDMQVVVNQFVVNEATCVVHRPRQLSSITSSWRTACGWRFATSRCAVLRPDPDSEWPRCAVCFASPPSDSE